MSCEYIALDLIKEAEGFRGIEYLCPAGYKTLGYGRNLELNPLSQEERMQCMVGNNGLLRVSQNVASDWVTSEIKKINSTCSEEWFYYLDDYRKAVIIDIIYNIGMKKWRTFTKCHEALIEKNFGIASRELKESKWFKQVGLRGLRNVEIMKMGTKINDFYKK